MKEEKILINGLEVNYKIDGEGFPLLILHGWGGSSDSWSRVQEILSAQGYKIIVPDLPGFGKSKRPPKTWGLKDYADFILKLTQKIGLENFFLLGHSFGGRIAIKFVLSHSEKIKGLILCSSAGIKQKWGPKEVIIFWISKIGKAIFTSKILRRFKDRARNIFYIFLRRKDYVRANGPMKEIIKKVLKDDLLPEISRIESRTLLIWGEKDKMVPLRYGRIFKEKIENSQLEIIPKIGHSPHLEVPVKLAKIISFFLNSNSEKSKEGEPRTKRGASGDVYFFKTIAKRSFDISNYGLL